MRRLWIITTIVLCIIGIMATAMAAPYGATRIKDVAKV